ncbi:MAG: cation:dicarboxylase symporter family transporter, partial [Clostridia bacterium]|nr:cation:dicarboxylase symporter family transporter [Clostridia bacterium]
DNLMLTTLQRMGQIPAWQYRYGKNVVLFTLVRKKVPSWIRMSVLIAVAILCGIWVRFMPDPIRFTILQSIVTPLLDTFLGFLNAIAGPMIFLSVIWGIYCIGDASTFSTIGKKVLGRFGFALVAVVLLVALCSLPFFHLNRGQVQGSSDFSTLYKMILDIVPNNLFTPFSRGNTLQILLLAVALGVTMLHISDRIQQVAGLVEQLGYVVNSMMEFVGKMVPYFVCGSLFSLIVSSDGAVLVSAAKVLLGMAISCVFIFLLETLYVYLSTHVLPWELWRRSLSTMLIGWSTASSTAALPDNLKVCTEKYHVRQDLAGFAVPFGQIIYKPCTALMFWFMAIGVAEQYGTPVSLTWFLMAFVLSLVLSVAAPPVSGGAAACFSILLTQLGLPMEAMAMILTLNIVLDLMGTGVNLFGMQGILFVFSRKARMTDRKSGN